MGDGVSLAYLPFNGVTCAKVHSTPMVVTLPIKGHIGQCEVSLLAYSVTSLDSNCLLKLFDISRAAQMPAAA